MHGAFHRACTCSQCAETIPPPITTIDQNGDVIAHPEFKKQTGRGLQIGKLDNVLKSFLHLHHFISNITYS